MTASGSATREPVTIEDLRARVGQELGVSGWREIPQEAIDAFAQVTGDDQFIHVDPVRAAAETPFGGAIAHGFLTLSLLSILGREVIPPIRGRRIGINYGLDKVRFLSPVRAGARIRARFVLAGVDPRGEAEYLLRYAVVMEIEGGAKPALAADWLAVAVLG